MALDLETLKYPIGKYVPPKKFTPAYKNECIARIEGLPKKLKRAVKGLNSNQLRTKYRPGGWTVRELINHIPDSHMNAYVRFKWALTEKSPVIKAYNEKMWVKTPEVKSFDISTTMALLDAHHRRWVELLRSMPMKDYNKKFKHPATGKAAALSTWVGVYAWHGEHHLAHITELKKRKGWK